MDGLLALDFSNAQMLYFIIFIPFTFYIIFAIFLLTRKDK